MSIAKGLRVLFWSDAFRPHIGGLAVWAARYVQALRDAGHDVRVVTPRLDAADPLRDDFRGIPVQRLPLWEALRAGEAAPFRESVRLADALCAEFRPHVVQLSPALGAPSLLPFVLSRAAHLPTLLTFHDDWPPQHTAPGSPIDRVARRAARVTTFSDASMAHLRGRWPGLAKHSSVIPHGMEPPPGRLLPTPEGPPTVAFVGRACRVKGLDVALEAFAAVARAVPTARLLVAGDDPERAGLQDLASCLGVAPRVDFLGWRPPEAVGSLLDRSALLAVPSRAEPFGLVAMEAAWHGRPVAASAVGGLPEVVLDGRTGFLCSPGDPAALADHLIRLLTDHALRRRLGAAARSHAEHRLAWVPHVAAFDRLLHAAALTRTAAGS